MLENPGAGPFNPLATALLIEAASVGSACHSATGHVSGVLAAQALVTAWIRLVNSDEGRQGYNLDELLRSQ
jgi:hypothetical protein